MKKLSLIFTILLTSSIAFTQNKEVVFNHMGYFDKQDRVEHYIKEYPNQQQAEMMNKWLENHDKATFSFSGLVNPLDSTVITPQATVDYGYNWFSVSEKPAILSAPNYSMFFSVSIFDMNHNVPVIVVNPAKPIVIARPGQTIPEGDYTIVYLETDQGLVFTRMAVNNNLSEVGNLRDKIKLEGGKGDMDRAVQSFSPGVVKAGNTIIEAHIKDLKPSIAFGYQSGDVGDITLAAAVMIGQLGTPSDVVKYDLLLTDSDDKPLKSDGSYKITIPKGVVLEGGYFSVTVYGVSNKLLIPNSQKRYDRTTYSSKQNKDGSYTVLLNPKGKGENAIPTGKDFYALFRAYIPNYTIDYELKIEEVK